MRSKTSCFNSTVFWKNVRRFWPLWTGYLLVWLLVLPFPLANASLGIRSDVDFDILRLFGLQLGLVLGVAMGALSAMAVWSFLYNARSAQGVACLPLRRENLYLSTVLSGLLPVLVDHAIVAACVVLVGLARYGNGYLATVLQWFALVSLLYFFFYCFATFCAMLTGHLLILPAVYVILNFVAVVVQQLLNLIFTRFVYGMTVTAISDWVRLVSPPMGLRTVLDVDIIYPEDPAAFATTQDHLDTGRTVVQGWGYLAAYAAVGLALLVCGLLIFRRRRMETAGDVVAVKPLKPVFRWCMALGCALVLSTVTNVLFLGYGTGIYRWQDFNVTVVFLLLGALIGWFGSEMLMKKTFRVFASLAGWGGFALCCALLSFLMVGMRYDLFGYERRVPDPSEVERVRITANGGSAELSLPESIAQATELHRTILADKEWNQRIVDDGKDGISISNSHWFTCSVSYDLKNGKHLSRSYQLNYDLEFPMERAQLQELQAVMNLPDALAARKAVAFPVSRDSIYNSSVSVVLSGTECAQAAGYGSPEDYMLRELAGLNAEDLRTMGAEERSVMAAQVALDYVENGWIWKFWKYTPVYDHASGEVYLSDGNGERFALEYDRLFFDYTWFFTPAEMYELYSTCVLPDIADGTLGRIWVIADNNPDYENTVYEATIDIHFRQWIETPQAGNNDAWGEMLDTSTISTYYDGADGGLYQIQRFRTIPTVDSSRTNAWLAAHGVGPLRLTGEVRNAVPQPLPVVQQGRSN